MILHCIVLYCIVLYYITLHCVILYCIVLYYIALYYIVLYCTIIHCIELYCTVLYCIVLYCIVLYFFVLYCIVLHYIVSILLPHFTTDVAPLPSVVVDPGQLIHELARFSGWYFPISQTSHGYKPVDEYCPGWQGAVESLTLGQFPRCDLSQVNKGLICM